MGTVTYLALGSMRPYLLRHQKPSEQLKGERNPPTHPVQSEDDMQIGGTASETRRTRWALGFAKYHKAREYAQESVSMHPMESILPHIPIRRVEQRPDMLSSLGRRADTSRQHRSIPYIDVSTPARNYQQTRSPDRQTYLLGTQGCAQTHRRPESHASTQNACACMHINAKDSRRPVVMPEAIRSPQSDLRMSYSPGESARWILHTWARDVRKPQRDARHTQVRSKY